MGNRDKDDHIMASSDLAAELTKVHACAAALLPAPLVQAERHRRSQDSFSCSADEEHKMCENLIKLLGDSATEVQGVAVKWCVGRALLEARSHLTRYRRTQSVPAGLQGPRTRAGCAGREGAMPSAHVPRAASAS